MDILLELFKKECFSNGDDGFKLKPPFNDPSKLIEWFYTNVPSTDHGELLPPTDEEIQYMAVNALCDIHQHTQLCIDEIEEHIFVTGFFNGFKTKAYRKFRSSSN